MAEKKEEKRDETPTRMQHAGGAFVSVPAYKVDSLLRAGTFTKASTKKS